MRERDRRALLIGGAIIVGSWIGFRVVPDAVARARFAEESIAQQGEFIARAKARLANSAQLGDSIQRLETVAEALPRLLLAGGDFQTASVDLTRRMREIVGPLGHTLGVQLRAEQVVSGALQLTSVTLEMETDFAGLMEAVGRVEADSALAMEALVVNAEQAGIDPAAPEKLVVRLGTSGWYRPEQAPRSDRPGGREGGS